MPTPRPQEPKTTTPTSEYRSAIKRRVNQLTDNHERSIATLVVTTDTHIFTAGYSTGNQWRGYYPVSGHTLNDAINAALADWNSRERSCCDFHVDTLTSSPWLVDNLARIRGSLRNPQGEEVVQVTVDLVAKARSVVA